MILWVFIQGDVQNARRREKQQWLPKTPQVYNGAPKHFIDRVNYFSDTMVTHPDMIIANDGDDARFMYLLVKGTIVVEKYDIVFEEHAAPYSFGDLSCFIPETGGEESKSLKTACGTRFCKSNVQDIYVRCGRAGVGNMA